MASPSQTESPRVNEDSKTLTVMPSTQQTCETKGSKSFSQQDKTNETDKKRRINASGV